MAKKQQDAPAKADDVAKEPGKQQGNPQDEQQDAPATAKGDPAADAWRAFDRASEDYQRATAGVGLADVRQARAMCRRLKTAPADNPLRKAIDAFAKEVEAYAADLDRKRVAKLDAFNAAQAAGPRPAEL